MTPDQIVGYAVAKMCRWEDLIGTNPPMQNISIVAPDNQVGYMPVYATLEGLQAEWGLTCNYMVLRYDGNEVEK